MARFDASLCARRGRGRPGASRTDGRGGAPDGPRHRTAGCVSRPTPDNCSSCGSRRAGATRSSTWLQRPPTRTPACQRFERRLRSVFANSIVSTRPASSSTTLRPRGSESLPVDPFWVACLVYLAYASGACNHRESAAQIEPLLAPFSEQYVFTAVSIVGPVATALGSRSNRCSGSGTRRKHPSLMRWMPVKASAGRTGQR